MKLTSAQIQQFYRAMLSAFPTRSALEQFALFQLGENLNVIAGGDTLSDLVFSLIRWAGATGRLEDLIRETQVANPGNAELLAFAQQLNSTSEGLTSAPPNQMAGEPRSSSTSPPSDLEAVKNQQKLLATYRRNLALLLQQRALHGSASAPIIILNEIAETRQEIKRCKTVLRIWNITVENDPNDTEELPL